MERNLHFEINWASLIVGSKFTVFALFYFVFEGNFPSTSPRGAYIWRGDLTEGFLRYRFGGLIFGGAYTWTGLFSEFYGMFFAIYWKRQQVTISPNHSGSHSSKFFKFHIGLWLFPWSLQVFLELRFNYIYHIQKFQNFICLRAFFFTLPNSTDTKLLLLSLSHKVFDLKTAMTTCVIYQTYI